MTFLTVLKHFKYAEKSLSLVKLQVKGLEISEEWAQPRLFSNNI